VVAAEGGAAGQAPALLRRRRRRGGAFGVAPPAVAPRPAAPDLRVHVGARVPHVGAAEGGAAAARHGREGVDFRAEPRALRVAHPLARRRRRGCGRQAAVVAALAAVFDAARARGGGLPKDGVPVVGGGAAGKRV